MKRYAYAALLVALLPITAAAQEPVPVLVQTDLLLFQHTSILPEQIDAIAAMPPRPGDTLRASINLSADSTGKGTLSGADSGIRLVESSGRMKRALKSIEDSENFKLLHQVSWQQPVHASHDAVYVALTPGRRGGLLKGNAKLSFERYFQLVITLLYKSSFQDSEPLERESPSSDTIFIHFRETMTDNVLYYLDHPIVGGLVQITVLESAPPSDPES